MNTTDLACKDGPCLFDLIADPNEEHNLNASLPAVTARLLARLQQLSSEMMGEEEARAALMPTVPPTADRVAWGSVIVATTPAELQIEITTSTASVSAPSAPSYGSCEKMAATGGFFGPWLGAACTDPSGFCRLVGRTCATPSGGGLSSNPSTPYYTGEEDMQTCMAKCTAATTTMPTFPNATTSQMRQQPACSCFDWSANASPKCMLHTQRGKKVLPCHGLLELTHTARN
jgi:hypothetical protein